MSDVLDDREYTINILLFWSNFLFYLSVPFHCTVSPLIEWCFGRQRVHTHTDLKQFVCRTIHSFEQMTRHLEGLLFLCLMHRHCLRCGVDSSISMSWLQGGHSSVQFKMVSVHSWKPGCATPHFWEVSPMLPPKLFLSMYIVKRFLSWSSISVFAANYAFA